MKTGRTTPTSTGERKESAMLDTLTAEFDALLARMQIPGFRKGMRDAFSAFHDELGRAAVAAARRRAG